jgi:hypothetical protein
VLKVLKELKVIQGFKDQQVLKAPKELVLKVLKAPKVLKGLRGLKET